VEAWDAQGGIGQSVPGGLGRAYGGDKAVRPGRGVTDTEDTLAGEAEIRYREAGERGVDFF
jgi:hypothetical protein